MIRVIQRVVVIVCMVLQAQTALAEGLQEIAVALAYPRKEVIAKIAERKGGDVVSALILERALIRKRADGAQGSPCEQVEDSLKSGCLLLVSANAISDGRFDDLRGIFATLDTRAKNQLFQLVPVALFEKLAALSPTRLISQAETNIALSTESEGFLQDSTKPVVDIEINGQKVSGALDTGASVTLISEQDARQLELTPLHYDAEIGTYYRAGKVKAALYQIKELKIGNTQMRDVVVLVGGQMTLIGLDMISRFDSLYLSPERIAINLSAHELANLEKECRARVFLNSDFMRFNQFLYFIAKVDGKNTIVALDSGYSGDYLATAIMPQGAVRDITSSGVVNDARGAAYEQPYSAEVEVEAGNKTIRMPAIFSGTRKLPAPYVLGWRGFSHYHLVYNVKSARACLI